MSKRTQRENIKNILRKSKTSVNEFKAKIDKFNSHLRTLVYPANEDEDIENEWRKLSYEMKNRLLTILINLEDSMEKL